MISFWHLLVLTNMLHFRIIDATFDLYVDSKDFKKLLGVDSELWYVRDGDVKENALEYVVLVPAEINVLTFHWRARHNIMLPYKLETHVGNPEAAVVRLNISNTGSIPTKLQSFQLIINCTGKLTTQVYVSMTLQLPLQKSLQHLTNITIQRRKICFRATEDTGVVVSVVSVRGASAVVYITVGCLAIFLIAVASLAAYNHRTNANKIRRRRDRTDGVSSMQMHAASPCLPNNTSAPYTTVVAPVGSVVGASYPAPQPMQQLGIRGRHGSQTSYIGQGPSAYIAQGPSYMGQGSYLEQGQGSSRAGSQRTQGTTYSGSCVTAAALGGGLPVKDVLNSSADASQFADKTLYTDSRQGDVSSKLSSVTVEGAQVELLECVMEGTFGRLYRALYRPSQSQDPVQVMLKTIADHSSGSQREMLLREAVMLVGLQHSNLLPVLSAIIPAEPAAAPKLLYPITEHGNMKRFLQSCGPLVTREVVSMGVQVLQAISFLHKARLLHCDVATRNCVVGSNLHVQMGDCALSRDLFPADYHCLGDNNNRPVKWLALEAIERNAFSPHSDVWSWGVLLWEIMTLGQQPYPEIDPFEMGVSLRRGIRLAQPINCPDEIFKAMTYCWTNSPLERPTVDELLVFLNNFLHHLDSFV
uniref:Tyrosine-protein kinase Drl-like n=1 Tax=Hirondellea gigas TaxID=1518452 RepID=A0A6A7FSR8_9CRUS